MTSAYYVQQGTMAGHYQQSQQGMPQDGYYYPAQPSSSQVPIMVSGQYQYAPNPNGYMAQQSYQPQSFVYGTAYYPAGPSHSVASPALYHPLNPVSPSPHLLPTSNGMQYPSGHSHPSSSVPHSPRRGSGSVNGFRQSQYAMGGAGSSGHHASSSSSGASVGGVSSLPAKPVAGNPGACAVRSKSGQQHGSSMRGSVSGDGGRMGSDASRRGSKASSSGLGYQLLDKLPPLPKLPSLPEPPVRLAAAADAQGRVEATEPSDATSEGLKAGEMTYLTGLLQTIEGYKAREDAMQLRVEALAFQPHSSWASLGLEDVLGHSRDRVAESSHDSAPASILGVRLLRKVAELQKENDELGDLLSRKLGLNDDDEEGKALRDKDSIGGEVEDLKADLADAHELLTAMSVALKEAESRASRAEKALELAVQSRSTPLT